MILFYGKIVSFVNSICACHMTNIFSYFDTSFLTSCDLTGAVSDNTGILRGKDMKPQAIG